VFGRQILSLTVNEPALTVISGLAASRLGLDVGFRLLMQELDGGHLLAAFGDLDLAPTRTSGLDSLEGERAMEVFDVVLDRKWLRAGPLPRAI